MMPKADPEHIEFHRKADAEIDLMENVQTYCTPDFLNQSDAAIADALEKEFGISAKAILAEFNAEDHWDYHTWELVVRAKNHQS